MVSSATAAGLLATSGPSVDAVDAAAVFLPVSLPAALLAGLPSETAAAEIVQPPKVQP